MKKLYSLLLSLSLGATSLLAIDSAISVDTTVSSDDNSSSNILVQNAALTITDNAVLTLSAAQYTLKLDTKGASLEISNGGSLICSNTSSGSLWVSGNTIATIKADAGDVEMVKAIISSGTLVLEKENALRKTNDKSSAIMVIGSGSVLHAKKSQDISQWDIRANSTLKFGEIVDGKRVGSGVNLTFEGISLGATSANRTITLEDFSTVDSIYFTNNTIISTFEDNKLTLFDASANSGDGKFITYTFTGMTEDLKLVTDKELGLTTSGATLVLMSAVVPEPAEWATILGAIALGLAVYRKRKA